MTSVGHFRSEVHKKRFDAIYDQFLASFPVAVEHKHLEMSFGQTHVMVSGAEYLPPLVLFHGYCGTNLMWQSSIEVMSKLCRVFMIECTGDAGRSVPKEDKPIDSEQKFVEWMCEVLDCLNLVKPVAVLGLSFGGYLAALLASKKPERVSKLILLAPGATFGNFPLQFTLRALPAILFPSITWFARKYWTWFLVDQSKANDPFTDLFVAGFTGWQFPRSQVSPREFTDEEIQEIKCPVTLIIGDQEVIYREGVAAIVERASKLLPTAQIIIPNASHALGIDAPEEVREAIIKGIKYKE